MFYKLSCLSYFSMTVLSFVKGKYTFLFIKHNDQNNSQKKMSNVVSHFFNSHGIYLVHIIYHFNKFLKLGKSILNGKYIKFS